MSSLRLLPVLASLALGLLAGCANNRAACIADCESRIARCAAEDVDCPALCGTYVDLGDPYGCANERLVYQGCVVDAACTTDCASERGLVDRCIAERSGQRCIALCRERDAAGCGDPNCASLCLGVEYFARGTDCRAEADRWIACLDAAPICDALGCLDELGDANDCRNAYCAANPSDPACG